MVSRVVSELVCAGRSIVPDDSFAKVLTSLSVLDLCDGRVSSYRNMRHSIAIGLAADDHPLAVVGGQDVVVSVLSRAVTQAIQGFRGGLYATYIYT